MSGTPIQNKLEELYPYFAFLKVQHTGDYDTFKNNYGSRTQASNMRLQQILMKIMVRRTHQDQLFGRPLVNLPDLNEQTVVVEFNATEKAVYKIVEKRFRLVVQKYYAQGVAQKNYSNILTLYLRLRQLVSHILLIQQTLQDLLEAEDLEALWMLTEPEERDGAAEYNERTLDRLRDMINAVGRSENRNGQYSDDIGDLLTSGEFCSSMGTLGSDFRKILIALRQQGLWKQYHDRTLCHRCGQPPTDPHITSCMHIYCKFCIEIMQRDAATEDERVGQTQARCIECQIVFERVEPCVAFDQAGAKVSKKQTPNSRRSADIEGEDMTWVDIGETILPSAKTLAVKLKIEQWQREEPEAKIIIFTQFRTMIKILSRLMQEQKIGCTHFHGGMNFAARDKAVKDFAVDPNIKVMLASLKAGGVGLNLTMASKVIILDLWWNQSVEQQAFCRAYRIGQEREVDVCRIGK